VIRRAHHAEAATPGRVAVAGIREIVGRSAVVWPFVTVTFGRATWLPLTSTMATSYDPLGRSSRSSLPSAAPALIAYPDGQDAAMAGRAQLPASEEQIFNYVRNVVTVRVDPKWGTPVDGSPTDARWASQTIVVIHLDSRGQLVGGTLDASSG
jgi:hypothetical protein